MLARELALRSPQAWHRISMGSGKAKILVVSRDPNLADVRRKLLEAAGYSVLEASSDQAVEEACSHDGINLIMLGYSLEPSLKRRVWAASRRYCDAPILELHHGGSPELVERNVFAHESKNAEDFLHALEDLLRKNRTRNI